MVSILIPARNESENILALLQSISRQNYDNFETIVLDDHSEDETFNLCQTFSETDSRFQVIRGEKLPAEWLGKNFACYQLAKHAKGKYLMFLDADEIVSDGLINNAVNRMEVQKLALLSLFTNQVMLTIGERLVVPLMHFLLLNLLPLRLVRLSKNPSFAAASGQFMLFNAQDYHDNQWHSMVKGKVVEDIEIMKLVKGLSYRGEALLANGLIHCRMYKNLNDALSGFSKNLLAGFNYNIAGLLFYLSLVILGPVVIWYYAGLELLLFAISLIILSRIMISLSSGQNPWFNLLLHPLQMVFLLILAVLSIQKYFTKTLTWKGRTIHT
ncbi:glycosyltransferase [Daejeonella oryzae]|uniref:glycosyltransferase n=1 Tax=Daejeonella oryzae TaxID=1122943 RepID=UPI0003F6135C|nr:glycosyltransferase family 2 protein [Daejeonella oryzae]